MPGVTIHELRNLAAEVLDRIARGEALTVTRDGHPIAELRPLPRRPLSADALLRRWHRLPGIDVAGLRADLDSTSNSSL